MMQELPQSKNNREPLHIICSEADYGTSSISRSYLRNLLPVKSLSYSKGFKRMGFKGWLSGARFIRKQSSGTLLCLFNAPIILAAIFRKKSNHTRVIGVLDWTESYPSNKKNCFTKLYDNLYLWAFSRMDDVYTPSNGFQKYYNERGARIKNCYYPLPEKVKKTTNQGKSDTVKVLFIGADIKRKGGDILLEEWKKAKPFGATLTFVSPNTPTDECPSVIFLNNIKTGTDEHRALFESHDILVLPSHDEPFGYVLLEAINYGMCTITTNAAGASQIVKNAGGIVSNSPRAACKEAIRLAQSREEIKKIRESCFDYALLYESFYREIVHKDKINKNHF